MIIDYDDNYSRVLWERIEKYSFFYPLWQIWNLNPTIRKIVLIIWVLSALWVMFVIYTLIGNKLISWQNFIIFLFAIGVILSLLPISIIFILFDKCRFIGCIYEKWIEIQWNGYSYDELKGIKLFQYHENWNEYIKLIYTEFDDRIVTETLLYNPKMDKFLEKIQESFQNKEINCEKISDIRNIDITDSIEYKTHFWFISVWKLLSWKERIYRIRNVMLFMLLYLFFWGIMFISSLLWEDTTFSETMQQFPENFYSWLKVFLIILAILVMFLTIHFILSLKKFYARMENNAVYIQNGYWWKWVVLSDNYVLSKIKVNYWFIVERNIEWIMLTVYNWGENTIYKRPKNEEVERFCNDLSAEVTKHKKI